MDGDRTCPAEITAEWHACDQQLQELETGPDRSRRAAMKARNMLDHMASLADRLAVLRQPIPTRIANCHH